MMTDRTPGRRVAHLQRITVRRDRGGGVWRAGESVRFISGVNLLVGDQGAGKSTLLRLIADATRNPPATAVHAGRPPLAQLTMAGPPVPFRQLDFEMDNPRLQPIASAAGAGAVMASHGEVTQALLSAMAGFRDSVVLMDEPDAALSPRSALWLAQELDRLARENRLQIIAAVHHPAIIRSQETVYCVDRPAYCRKLHSGRQWLSPDRFLAMHGMPTDNELVARMHTAAMDRRFADLRTRNRDLQADIRALGDELNAARDQLRAMQPEAVFAALAHGDDEHQEWLREAIHAIYTNQPIPPTRGNAEKEARIRELELKIEQLMQ